MGQSIVELYTENERENIAHQLTHNNSCGS